MTKSILNYLNEFGEDLEDKITDFSKKQYNNFRDFVGNEPKSFSLPDYHKFKNKAPVKPAPKLDIDAKTRSGHFDDNDPEVVKSKLEEPSEEKAREDLEKKQKEWEPSTLTNNIVTNNLLPSAAIAAGAYMLYKRQHKKDKEEKEQTSKIDPKFKKDDIKKI